MFNFRKVVNYFSIFVLMLGSLPVTTHDVLATEIHEELKSEEFTVESSTSEVESENTEIENSNEVDYSEAEEDDKEIEEPKEETSQEESIDSTVEILEIIPNDPTSVGPAAEEPEIELASEIHIPTDQISDIEYYDREDVHQLAMEMMEQDLEEKGLEPTNVSSSINNYSFRRVSSGIKHVDEFIAKIAPFAMEDSVTSGVLPSITIAQGALESAWGLSGLTINANNLFGIKASSDWKGPVYNVITKEYSKPVYDSNGKLIQADFWYEVIAPFRKYNNWLESIRDHGEFFTGTEWRKNNYKNVVGEKDYRKAAQALKDAGYATDPDYPQKLISIIENYELYKYDQVPFLSADYHVQNKGWLATTGVHAILGTTGKSLRLEDLRLRLPNDADVGIQFDSWVQNRGWSGWIEEGKESGNTGKSLRMEAIKIRLTGARASYFDVMYRVHTEGFGWSGWTKNGQPAGFQGYGKRIEAVEVKMVWAGDEEIASNQPIVYQVFSEPSVVYSSHVQGIGWMSPVKDGAQSGTVGYSKRVEAVKLALANQPYYGDIVYQTHIQGIGWMNTVKNNTISGTTGRLLRAEAIKISLTGQMDSNYDIYYRSHIQKHGWTGWAKNGEPSGSTGQSLRLEALEIRLVKKGQQAPGIITNTLFR